MKRSNLKGLLVTLVTAGVVVGAAWVLLKQEEQRPTPSEQTAVPDPLGSATDARTLREQLLHGNARQLGLTPVRGVWGVLMERGYSKGVATVVALTDGTASMYISTGGAVTGAKAFAPARTAAQKLCAEAADALGELRPATDFPPPAKGRVRFFVLTDGGVRTGEGDILPAGHDGGRAQLAPLIAAGDALLDSLRDATTKGYVR